MKNRRTKAHQILVIDVGGTHVKARVTGSVKTQGRLRPHYDRRSNGPRREASGQRLEV